MSDMPSVLLFSFAGKPAPPELAPALRLVAELPTLAQKHFGELVTATLEMLPEDQIDNRIVRHCRKLQIDPEKAAPAIKSTRFLIRHAASANATPDQLAQDLRALCSDGTAQRGSDTTPGGSDTVAELVVPIYERALPAIRAEIIQGALRSHGNVLSALEWRIDTIGASNLGTELSFPVALLTLHYQDRQQAGSFTVQMTSDMVAELRELCDQLLKP